MPAQQALRGLDVALPRVRLRLLLEHGEAVLAEAVPARHHESVRTIIPDAAMTLLNAVELVH